MATTATAQTNHTCDCKVCNGLTITAPAGYISGTPKQVRDLTHSYVQYAHGRSPIGATMCKRAGIAAV